MDYRALLTEYRDLLIETPATVSAGMWVSSDGM